MDKVLDRLVNVIVLAFVGYAVLRPEGPVRQKWEDRAARARIVAFASSNWRDLVGESSALDGVVVEFMDYQCPSCRVANDTVSVAVERDGIHVVYRHLPLVAIHPRAADAARMAICAENQGVFSEIHQFLLTSSSWQAEANPMVEAAAIAGVPDTAVYRRCFDASATLQRLARDRELADSMGIRATPAFVSRTGYQQGLVGVDALVELSRQP